MSAQRAHQLVARRSSIVETDTTAEQDELAPTNRRAARRLVVAELSWLESIRIKYGPQVTLLDLSPGGAQIETAGYRLQPGTTLVLEFKIAGEIKSYPAQVMRSQLASLAPQPTYRGSVLFRRPFEFPTAAKIASSDAEDPASEFARLNLALRRVASTDGPALLTTGRLTPTGARALDTALALILSSSGGEPVESFSRGMARLLRETAEGVERAAAPEAIVTDMVETLRRAVPSLAVRVIEHGPGMRVQPDAVRFQIPSEQHQPATHLAVELAKDCGLDDWHLQYLECAAQLIGGIRTLAAAA